MAGNSKDKKSALTRYVTPLGAWALAFGCSVGWGAFVMPGTTFLPTAGPFGTVLGIVIGGLIMLVIGANYHYLINQYPDEGGTYTYSKINFGYDHGFLSAWFMVLTYVAIIWANATALPLICRNLFGGIFKIGFLYEVAGFQVYFGEILLATAALVIAAFVCIEKKAAQFVQIVMALMLLGGIAAAFFLAAVSPRPIGEIMSPPFVPGKSAASGVFTIIALAPWAYVGFESISHSASEFDFSPKRSFRIMTAAVILAAAAYGILAVLAVSVLPEGCSSWPEYIANIGSYDDIRSLPTFYSSGVLFGQAGTILIGLTTLGAIVTGLVGNYIASSRLLYALAEDRMLPEWFGKLNEKKAPDNAILFILLISVILPFFGRTAISWIVDVTTVGATIAYAYTSGATLKTARKNGDTLFMRTGMAGVCISLVFVLFFLVPNLISVSTLSKESYLILASWSILGLLFFLFVFRNDEQHRLGRSTVTWIVLLALIIFTSTIWMKQETEAAANNAYSRIIEVSSEAGQNVAGMDAVTADAEVQSAINGAESTMIRTNLIQTGLIVVALAILFMIYSLMQKREKQMEVEKVLAEESSRAKTSFLSNMSHEIRTPMNAIIGLDNIALKDPKLTPHTREQLEKIGASARHLLSLINDILDMSRIESGRMVLKEEEFSFRDFLDQVNVIINGQCQDKGLNYECHIIGSVNDYYVGDDMKLRQVLINILGNAVKFTNVPGSVTFTVEQTAQFEGFCTLSFIMKDTGVGMSKEFIPKIFDAFSQEDTSTLNKYGSTGLGMAITKNIVEMMNGDIDVESEKGVGTTFTVTVTLKTSSRSVHGEHAELPVNLSMLIVDDDEVACEHAGLVAGAIGMMTDHCLSAEKALELIRQKRENGTPYQVVLTDYKMPGMDGIEFTRALRTFDNGDTAVIVLTGYSWDDMQEEARIAGVDGIMSKPVFTDSLLRELHKVLEMRAVGERGLQTEMVELEPAGRLEGMHVLIAEDFEINAEILIDLLEMEGVSADHAENGQIAVDMFEEQPEFYYDAILMDVRMPVMDGLAAAREIRKLAREDAGSIPIIALTANAFDEDVQRSLQSGMSAHLSKPVEPERLFETLDRLVKRNTE